MTSSVDAAARKRDKRARKKEFTDTGERRSAVKCYQQLRVDTLLGGCYDSGEAEKSFTQQHFGGEPAAGGASAGLETINLDCVVLSALIVSSFAARYCLLGKLRSSVLPETTLIITSCFLATV